MKKKLNFLSYVDYRFQSKIYKRRRETFGKSKENEVNTWIKERVEKMKMTGYIIFIYENVVHCV